MDERLHTAGAAVGDARWQVTVRYPGGERRLFPCRSPTVYLGCSLGNDICLAHPYVAMRHLRLEMARDDVLVTDLGSDGNTRLHGEPVQPFVAQRLGEGEAVEVGPLQLTVERILDAEIVEGEAFADEAMLPAVSHPRPLPLQPALPMTPAPGTEPGPLRGRVPGAPPQRSDFLSWRSSLVGSAVAAAPRHATWPRLFGFIAGAVIFAALVALIVLVAL